MMPTSGLIVPGLLAAATVLVLAAVLLPAPPWTRRHEGDVAARADQGWRVIPRSLWLSLLGVAGGGAFVALGAPLPLAAVGTLLVTGLVAPLISDRQNKRLAKRGRLEALMIAEYISGRMNARATLLLALESVSSEHQRGGRAIPVCAAGLENAIRAVNLGQPLGEQLRLLAELYAGLPELSGLWQNLAIMADSSLGVEAMAAQAGDLARNLRLIDELKDTLETELTVSSMTRLFMFFLIGGFILFLVFSGGSMGDVLVNTLAGNILVGFAILTLYAAQVVGSRIEKLPPLWF